VCNNSNDKKPGTEQYLNSGNKRIAPYLIWPVSVRHPPAQNKNTHRYGAAKIKTANITI